MTLDRQTFDAPGGPLSLRQAEPDDEAFQYELFVAHREPPFRSAGLPEALIGTLLVQQFRARDGSYRAAHPGAQWLIVERGGERIGALIADMTSDVAHIVDIALHLEWQGRGLGPALVRQIMREAGSGVRAMADVANARSRRMFERLGFHERPSDDGANVELLWPREDW